MAFKIEKGVLTKYIPEEGETEVVIPEGVTTIGGDAFSECDDLISVTISEGVQYFGWRAFSDCRYLKNVTFQSASIFSNYRPWKRMGPFEGCSSLSTVIFSEGTKSIGYGLFYNRDRLKNVVIPDSVEEIEDYAFYGTAISKLTLGPNVQKLGRDSLGCKALKTLTLLASDMEMEDIGLPEGALLFAEKLPLSKVNKAQRLCALNGFAQRYLSGDTLPESYQKDYLKYIKSQRKKLYPDVDKNKLLLQLMMQEKLIPLEELDTLLASCKNAKTKELLEAYKAQNFGEDDAKALKAAQEKKAEKAAQESEFSYRISGKLKLSEQKKVELLHEVVATGTLDDLRQVYAAYAPFEFTAGALALAWRYRGMDFVKLLLKNGATFTYDHNNGQLTRKYKTAFVSRASFYATHYYLIPLVREIIPGHEYTHTHIYGVLGLPITQELEQNMLNLAERLEIAAYLFSLPKMKKVLSPGEMLYWALLHGDLDVADGLMALGADLDRFSPSMDALTGSGLSGVAELAQKLSNMDAQTTCGVLERFCKLTAAAGKKIAMKKSLYESIHWSTNSVELAFAEMDMSRIPPKTLLELAVSRDAVGALAKAEQDGWIKMPKQRDELIALAQKNKHTAAAAWLLEYKNRTADFSAEAAAEEKKLMKELTEDPNSVSAMKRVWGYKRQEDGTLCITSYKGNVRDVVIPARIGKDTVTTIDAKTFDPYASRLTLEQQEARKQITSITVPGTIRMATCSILPELESVTLESGVQSIGESAFAGCRKLKNISIPDSVTEIGAGAFSGCFQLSDISLPAGLKTLGKDKWNVNGVFRDCSGLKHIQLPDGLETLGREAFYGCTALEEIEIPGTVKAVRDSAFRNCSALKKVIIGEGVEEIADWAFGGCKRLEELVLPASLQKVGLAAFEGCTALQSPTLSDGSDLSLRDGIFLCRDTALIRLIGARAELVIPGGITQIEKQAIACSKTVTHIVLPEGLTKIGENAFSECEALTAITLPTTLKTIGKEAFSYCYRLKEVEIPAGVTDIDPEAFYAFSWNKINVTIRGVKGSYAEQYADDFGLEFKAI